MKKVSLLLAIVFISCIATKAQNFNLELRGHVDYAPFTGSSLWGYADPSGNEYALVGTGFGVSIVDINDPDNPQVLFDVVHAGTEFPGLSWREVKTWDHYAYASNEAGNGLLIIDLQYLPDSIHQYQFIYTDPSGDQQTTGHTLWIDEKGRLFVFGNNYNYGSTIFDLTADPINPPLLGLYSNHYIHDGFVRGDTLWASEIYDGQLEIVDVSDPANPQPMASFHTPSFFTHNSWPTHDNHYVFTTDEVPGSYLTSYDVSDLSDISEMDRVQDVPGTDVIVHNVHLLNDEFAVTAYYCDGVVIFDVLHPDNMVKVAAYDIYSGLCSEFNGTWGVYPYLPSGTIIASNIEDGLYILTPTYQPACWLEGIVTDSLTQAPLNGVSVEILSTTEIDQSNLSGVYKAGYHAAGTYSVRYSKAGYATKVMDVVLANGQVTNIDVPLAPSVAITVTGVALDSATGAPIANAQLFFTDNVSDEYSVATDVNGNFSVTSFLTSTYDIIGGSWGHKTIEISAVPITPTSGPLTVKLPKGYYDDFVFNLGWTVSGDATQGIWERGEPVGTSGGGVLFNPDLDLSNDYGEACFVTGNNGLNVSSDQVNGGHTILTSPVLDLSIYDDPKISYYRWFANGGGSGGGNDSMIVTINNGMASVTVEIITKDNTTTSAWVYHEFNVEDFILPTSNMTIQISVGDQPTLENWVEGAIDQFQVMGTIISTGFAVLPNSDDRFGIFPNPFTIQSVFKYDLENATFGNARMDVYNAIGRLVETHVVPQGNGLLIWGENLVPGMYFVKVSIDGEMQQVISVVRGN